MTVTKEKARKKTIAGLLALAMGASALPAAPVLAGEGGGAPAWTACTECSEESPHIITTKEELDAIRTHINTEGHVDGYFQLGDDIVLRKPISKRAALSITVVWAGFPSDTMEPRILSMPIMSPPLSISGWTAMVIQFPAGTLQPSRGYDFRQRRLGKHAGH